MDTDAVDTDAVDADAVWRQLARRVTSERAGRPGYSVGIAGPVAAGKSVAAALLASLLQEELLQAELPQEEHRAAAAPVEIAVVSTDGFLFPNAELARRGLLDRKGFPETYDLQRLAAVVEQARAGEGPIPVPVYSHDRYDVLEDPAELACPCVLVVEGVVALQPAVTHDLAVYLDVDESVVLGWYVGRFLALVEAARSDPSSFYVRFAGLGVAEVDEVARLVWEHVNGPNLRAHIAPTRQRADVVVEKGQGHRVLAVHHAHSQ